MVEFQGSNTFAQNNGTHSTYPALRLQQCNVTLHGSATFLQNKGWYGGAIYAEDAEINFQGNLVFLENEARYGGTIYAKNSYFIISIARKLSFLKNEAYKGGAMTLVGHSTTYLEAYSCITFVQNHAYHYGGAIYFADDYTDDFEPAGVLNDCFYGILNAGVTAGYAKIFNDIQVTQISIEFYNNTTGFAGAAIYGGWVDFCIFNAKEEFTLQFETGMSQILVFNSLFQFHQSTRQLSLISSNPTRVCLCTNTSFPDCSVTEYTITAYPGETLAIPAVAVGQRFGTVPFIVQSSFVSSGNGNLPELLPLQYTQLVNANCTQLMYTIMSTPNRTKIIKLTVEKHNVPQDTLIEYAQNWHLNKTLLNVQFSELTIHIKLRTCPLGFVFNSSSQTCTCHPKLQQHKLNCSINIQTVYRRCPVWINATFLNETYTQVLVPNHCPFDYCKNGNIQLNMEQLR